MPVSAPSNTPVILPPPPPLPVPTISNNADPSTITTAIFDAQTDAVRLSYLYAKGSGQPLTVTIGATGAQRAYYIDTTGVVPVVKPRPTNWLSAPSQLTATSIATWTEADIVAYINKQSTTGKVTLSDSSVFSLTLDGTGAFKAPTDFSSAPSTLTLTIFEAWTTDQKLVYLKANGTGEPVWALIGTSSGSQRAYYLEPGVGGTPTLGVRPSNWTNAPDSLTSAQFNDPSWSDADRIAYVGAKGSPIGGGQAVTLKDGEVFFLSQGKLEKVAASFAVAPSTDDTIGAAQAAAFRKLSTVAQLAYIAQHGVGTPKSIAFGAPPSAAVFYTLLTDPGGTGPKVPDVRLADKQLPPVLERPSNWTVEPASLTSAAFAAITWTEQDRIDYVRTQMDANRSLTISSGDDDFVVMLSAGGDKLFYVAQNGSPQMDKRSISKMSTTDQTNLAAIIRTDTALKDAYEAIGLVVDPATDVDSTARGLVSAAVTNFRNKARATGGTNVPTSPADSGDTVQRFTDERQVFLDELQLLQDDIDNQKILSPQDITDKINKITERADRWLAFWPIEAETRIAGGDAATTAPYTQVYSATSTNAALVAARLRLIKQEEVILAVNNQKKEIAQAGTYQGKNLDVPTLVFLFQQAYNKSVEAEVAANTEELNQINDLLKSYALMQNMVNAVAGGFSSKTSDPPEKRGLSAYSSYSDQEQRAISMFDDQASATRSLHPMEKLKLNSSRNVFDLIGFTAARTQVVGSQTLSFPASLGSATHEQTYWNQMSQTLNNNVTTLNQESQTKMNDINSLDKQKNRHFDLANGALSKMSEIIQSIGRNIS